jgi:GGDEF domain-containing protein
MKLKHKGFIIIGFLWVFFLALNHFSAIRQSLLSFLTLGSLCAISMWWLLQTFIIKRVEQLNKQLEKTSIKDPALLPIHIAGNDEVALIAQQINELFISSHSQAEKQTSMKPDNKKPLAWLTHHDAHTLLPNHIFFNETVNKAMSHAKRHNKLLAVLLVDVNPVNMTKPISTTLFDEIKKRLTSTLRNEDILVKLEGQVFSVLLNDIGKAKFASAVANKIVQACAQPMTIENHE